VAGRRRAPATPEGSSEERARARELRLALEELGATFVKLGQVLATRSDLLPPAYLAELGRLHDRVAPVPFEAIKTVLEAELGRPLAAAFAFIEATPLAAASLGQVHVARLPDGREVAVKVQRPGVRDQVELDLALMQSLAATAARYAGIAREQDLDGLVGEFASSLRAELDYTREARSIARFAAVFAGDSDVVVPGTVDEFTTERVLVMERLSGAKVDDPAALAAAGADRAALAASVTRVMLEGIFEHGLFHADPHPGNLLALGGGRLGLLDLGSVGEVDDYLRSSLTRLLIAFEARDAERALDVLLELGVGGRAPARGPLRRDLARLISDNADATAAELADARLFQELAHLARKHGLVLPGDLLLMTRAMALTEGVALQLHPGFRLLDFARPILERSLLQRYAPGQVSEGDLAELAEFGRSLPRRVARLAGQVERGEVGGTVRLSDLERLLGEARSLTNRLATAVLVGALAVSLNLFMLLLAQLGLFEERAGSTVGLLFLVVTPLLVVLAFLAVSGGRRA
jgi:ubiquinone biosynthesis protein